MVRRLLVAGAAVAAVLFVLAIVATPPAPTAPPETLGQRADRECAGKPDPAWCRDKILLQPAFDAAANR